MPFPALKDRAKLIPPLRGEEQHSFTGSTRLRRRSCGEKYLGLGADGESEPHRTAGGRAAGGSW